MKLIFLDFDGVLNSLRWVRSQSPLHDYVVGGLDSDAVARVKKIMDTSGAKIVVSSSWRLFHPLSQLQDLLEEYDIDRNDVVGVTPFISGPRGDEIAAYLRQWPLRHNRVESCVILDDDDDMTDVYQRLVHTKWEDGLLDEHIPLALSKLNTPWDPDLELT